MEIRSRSELETIGAADLTTGDLLRGVLAELEASVDKTELAPFEILSVEEQHEHEQRLIADKDEASTVVERLKPFSDLAFTIHRTITGASNRLSSYGKERAKVRDAAIVAFAKRQEEIAAEETKRLQDVGRAEDEARRREEAAELTRRGKKENRPDLLRQATAIRNEPAREISVNIGRAAVTHSAGVGLRKNFEATVLDEERFILAIGKHPAYLELAAEIKKKFKSAEGKKIAAWILEQATMLPQIGTQHAEARASVIKRTANDTNGKINWPGVAIDEITKTTTRRARR